MHEINKIINKASLTKAESAIRAYILDRSAEACFMTSTDIALAAGVSEATVIRFTRKLGFGGFTDFQKKLRFCYQKEHNRVSENITVPHERLLKSLETGDPNYVEQYALSAQNNIMSAVKNNRREKYERAVDIIMASENKYVLGSRANVGLASYTCFLMNCMVKGAVFANSPVGSQIDNLIDISERDCLIAFSFPRYSRMDELAADQAHQAGAKIITITDRASAPLAASAQVVFTVDISSPQFFNSFVAVQHILETLCAGISRRVGRDSGDKLKSIDKYLDILKIY
ncbi:MurR/RpiR family transcriptional regulator [Deltaproteobacteria bacterium OttesenSCG-928-K17]|nr:MurR/RpiR family transcriptional regulator [Deltaproteobacteria bacterium OttesenSCG-928-K17]